MDEREWIRLVSIVWFRGFLVGLRRQEMGERMSV